MRYYISLIFFLFFLNVNYAQVSYCDSINILISNQSLTSVTCSSSTNGMNTFWNSQDWVLTDENGIIIANVSGTTATFSMPNPMNSDTNLICVTSILSSPVLTIACNTCDTLVWDGVDWVLLSMMNPVSCIDSSLIDTFCVCPMIYAPVCACNGFAYSNACLATCDGNTIIGPVDPTLVPGQPCSLTPTCEVEIDGDSIICNWGSPQILTASPTASSPPFVSYLWSNGQTGPVLTITTPGVYCVTATDATGCTSSECFTVTVQDIPIVSVPSPPNICIGDTIVLEIDTSGLFNITWIPNSLPTPPVHRIVLSPMFPTACVVEAIDAAGCDRRGEILINVDSCNTQPCVVEINNGAIDIEICDGDTAVLEATNGFDTYSWALNGSTGALLGTTHMIFATNPGVYTVVVTDSINCVDIDSIEVSMYPVTSLTPVTVPSPPMICLGDSLVIEVNPGFTNYWWNTGNPNDTDQDRVVVYPTQDFTYVVEALDINGCEAREEIEVFVDTCNNTNLINLFFEEVVIYPNPTNSFVVIDLPNSEEIDVLVYSVTGQLISDFRKISNKLVISETVLSKGTYIVHLIHRNGVMIDKIIVR